MKSYFVVLIMFIVGFWAPFCRSTIINGDFESGSLSPWVNPQNYPGKWAIDTAKTHSGNFSAHTETGPGGGVYALQQSFSPILVDNIIAFNYWYYAETSLERADIAVGLWFTDGSYKQDYMWGITLNKWTNRDVMPTLSQFSGKYLEKIGIYDTVATSTWIDDVQMEVIPEPSTIFMFGLGVPILSGFLRRKKLCQ